MSIGEKITELRKEKELTQTELAEKLQIGQSTVSEWEHGVYEPTASAIPGRHRRPCPEDRRYRHEVRPLVRA